jgi:uncharacterized phage protein (TIGR01671 family)
MSRPISFRAWSNEQQNFYYFSLPDKGAATTQRELPSRKLQEFTGLLDKNGREIYEGDIVTFEDSAPWDDQQSVDITAVVYFESGAFHLRYIETSDDSNLEVGEDLEVIGNICENKGDTEA